MRTHYWESTYSSIVDSTAKVIGNSRVDACEHGDGDDVSHSIVQPTADILTIEDFVLCFQQYYANTIFRDIYCSQRYLNILVGCYFIIGYNDSLQSMGEMFYCYTHSVHCCYQY